MNTRISEGLADQILWYFDTGVEGFKLSKQVHAAYAKHYRLARVFSILAPIYVPMKRFKYVFLGTKFKSLLKSLDSHQVLVIGGLGDMAFCLRNNIRFVLDSEYKGLLYQASLCEPAESEQCIIKLVNVISRSLSRFQPEALVVTNDSLPLERAWIAAARRIKVKSVCIQHGVFSARSQALADGRFADAMLVYDRFQKKIVARGSRNPEMVIPIGYHSEIVKLPLRDPSERKVCILGQPWIQYYGSENYLAVIKKIIDPLKMAGVPVVYKPHPGEMGGAYLSGVGCALFQGGLEDSIAEFDVFVSLTSTALMEASLAGKVSIQIYDPAFCCERFDELGYAHVIDEKQISNLAEAVRSLDALDNSEIVERSSAASLSERFRQALCSMEPVL